MNDERLNQYRNEANLDKAAKEFSDKQNGFERQKETLRSKEADLTNRYDKVNEKIGATDPSKEPEKWDELSKESQGLFDEREGVKKSLASVEAEQESFRKEYEAKAQQAGGQEVSKDQSPGNLERQFTPDPRDAGKQDKPGQDKTVQEAGETLHNSGVEAEEKPKNDNRLNQWQEQAKEQQSENVHENTLGNDRVSGGMQQDEPER